MVVASFLSLWVGPLSLSLPTAGLFAGPVSAEFGWNRATFFLGPSIGAIVGALIAPFLGAQADRWGVKPVLAVGVIIYAVGVAALGSINGSLPAYLVINVLLFGAGQVQTSPLYSKAVASWFDKKRGMMIALATCGFGVGGFIMPMIAKRIMQGFGWRWTYATLGLLILCIALPVVLLVIRDRPLERDTEQEARAALSGLSLREAARTRSYWTLIAFFLCVSFSLTGVVVNLVPMLVGRGVSMQLAVLAVSTVAISQTCGRLASGYLLDKIPVPQVSLLWFLSSVIGLSVLVMARSPPNCIFAAAMLGLAWGAEGEMTGYYVSRYFGLRHLARIAGTMFVAIGLTTAASQMVVARLFDLNHDYKLAVIIALVSMLAACALLASLGPYVFKGPDIDEGSMAQPSSTLDPQLQFPRGEQS